MIEFKSGNLFDSNCQTLVNTVNTVGVMGKGIALQFKQKYRKMYEFYRRRCLNNEFRMGDLLLYKGCPDGKWVLNFPTKIHWMNPSKLEYIEVGLKEFVSKYHDLGITSIAFPKLGCNNGGLKWEVVKPMMIHWLCQCNDIKIEIYE